MQPARSVFHRMEAAVSSASRPAEAFSKCCKSFILLHRQRPMPHVSEPIADRRAGVKHRFSGGICRLLFTLLGISGRPRIVLPAATITMYLVPAGLAWRRSDHGIRRRRSRTPFNMPNSGSGRSLYPRRGIAGESCAVWLRRKAAPSRSPSTRLHAIRKRMP